MTLLYRLGRGLARFQFSVFGRLEVVGQEAVPPYGPLLVVSNHLSYADPPLLMASLPRSLHFIGKQELFANPISRVVFKGFHVHPLNRSDAGIAAMREALRLLAQDHALVIFPEGRRSPDHTMKEGMTGAAYLAMKSQAPVLPVGLTGTENFPSWRMPFPFCRLKANIGQPFTPPVLEGKPSREVVENIRDMIMYRIAALLPPEYQGVYAISGLGERVGTSVDSR